MGESMHRINKKIEALPHEARLSNYAIQAFIAEYAFQHRPKQDQKTDEYDAMPQDGNTVMKWWMDHRYHDTYREYVDRAPEAVVDPHSEEQLEKIVRTITAYKTDETLH